MAPRRLKGNAPMAAQRYNLIIDQAATFKLDIFRYTDSSQSQAVDLTGHKIQITIRQNYDSTDELYSDDSSQGSTNIVIDAVTGHVTVTIPSETTAGFPAPYSGVYDLLDTDGNGNVVRLLEGIVSISPGVTRAA